MHNSLCLIHNAFSKRELDRMEGSQVMSLTSRFRGGGLRLRAELRGTFSGNEYRGVRLSADAQKFEGIDVHQIFNIAMEMERRI